MCKLVGLQCQEPFLGTNGYISEKSFYVRGQIDKVLSIDDVEMVPRLVGAVHSVWNLAGGGNHI